MATIKVMGHCPPDTDSTCSPIAYSWFLNKYRGLDTKPFVGGALNREAQFVLNYFKVETPTQIENVTEEDKLVLIDTNNPEELISGWDTSEIVEIVDHHKLTGLKTSNIPLVTIRPYGCVATVLWELMAEAHNDTPKEIAGLLLSCILSDTLNLTSPTTTDTDKKAVSELSKITDVNPDELSSQMFDAKSNLEGMSASDILLTDAKDFEFGGKIYKIGVLETTSPSQALGKKDELATEMKTIIENEKLAGFMFFVVDIIKSNATLIASSEEDLALVEKAFNVTRNEDQVINLPGVVSRKKQIVPMIEKAVTA